MKQQSQRAGPLDGPVPPTDESHSGPTGLKAHRQRGRLCGPGGQVPFCEGGTVKCLGPEDHVSLERRDLEGGFQSPAGTYRAVL